MNELRHIALAPDGNRRWAKKRAQPAIFGHKAGVETMIKITRKCFDLGIEQVTFWAMSTENLKRSKEEVEGLFDLFESSAERLMEDFEKEEHRASVKFYGDLDKFPENIVEKIKKIEERSAENTERRLNIMLGYGGRFEIAEAFKKIVKSGEKEITEELIKENLFVKDDVDLIVRTGGMKRLSGFMLFQSAYSEIYFTDTLWPDFDEEELLKALEWFNSVKRNFGR